MVPHLLIDSKHRNTTKDKADIRKGTDKELLGTCGYSMIVKG